MDYREFAPRAPLAPYVDRIWTLIGSAGELDDTSQPVLPDGRPELVLHFGDAFDRIGLDGGAVRQAGVLIAGQLTGQLLLRPTGRVAVLGVRFHPFGVSAFTRVPQQSLAGLTPALEDVDAALARELRMVRCRTDAPDAAVPLVQTVLERAVRPSQVDPRVREAAARIRRTRGAVSIDSLASATGWSRRQLERKFLETVGLAPKRLARIVRFQAALSAMERSIAAMATVRGAETAAAFGYADQSHFIREFRELAGCPPGEHGMRDALLTGFFITDSCNSSQSR